MFHQLDEAFSDMMKNFGSGSSDEEHGNYLIDSDS